MVFRALLFDLDGTVYRGEDAIEGAPELFAELLRSDIKYRFITNRSNRAPAAVAEHLRAIGIHCEVSHVLTSAHAAADFARARTVYCIGEEGLTEALKSGGAKLVEPNASGEHLTDIPELVIVGYDRRFDYQKLSIAARLVRAGAHLISTNPDPFINSTDGIIPENGALVSAIETASGVRATTLGKPNPFLAQLAMREMDVTASETAIIGDNPDTDILCGLQAGVTTVLMLTGVTSEALVSECSNQPHHVARNYSELRSILFR